MAIDNDLHTLFEVRRKVFKILDGQSTDTDLNCIIEELAKLPYPIQFDNEGGKHNLIVLIMDKANYANILGAPFPHPNRPARYSESIANGATSVIYAKSKAIHCDRITDWGAFEPS